MPVSDAQNANAMAARRRCEREEKAMQRALTNFGGRIALTIFASLVLGAGMVAFAEFATRGIVA